ncbi:hypothetical protein [Nitrospira calida]
MTEALTLLSTVVAPAFVAGRLELQPVSHDALPTLLGRVTRNLCGHPVTDKVLRDLCPSLPPQEKAFWTGQGVGLAIRPKGGVRGAGAQGDVQVTLEDLEAVLVTWHPSVV